MLLKETKKVLPKITYKIGGDSGYTCFWIEHEKQFHFGIIAKRYFIPVITAPRGTKKSELTDKYNFSEISYFKEPKEKIDELIKKYLRKVYLNRLTAKETFRTLFFKTFGFTIYDVKDRYSFISGTFEIDLFKLDELINTPDGINQRKELYGDMGQRMIEIFVGENNDK